jgi:release factor glutamine methyltransferase
VLATDVSDAALIVAEGNSRRLGATVEFGSHNILQDKPPGSFDIIVSNPPYIEGHEKNSMSKNVVAYEPEIALFVNSDDPLLFYKAIVRHAMMSLGQNGLLAVEINERFGHEVLALFVDNNFQDAQLLQDVFGKNRIVKGVLSS